jgi:hypothetical protein
MTSAALEAVLSEFSTLVKPASHLERPAPPTVPCGIAAVDELTGGLPRGCLTEICGPASSGRTSLILSALAEATARGEVCALVDASDCFDPLSAEQAGVDLERLLWVRCQHSALSSQQSEKRHSALGIRHSEDPTHLIAGRHSENPTHSATEIHKRKEQETRFINSGIENCGSKGVHTERMYSGMPAIPEVNVLTRPEQRYRDISKLKQGDYREAWQSDLEFSSANFEDHPGKIPPQRHRGTEAIGSSGHRVIGSSNIGRLDVPGIERSTIPSQEFSRIDTDKTEKTIRRGSTRVGADLDSEVRNQKSEFESGEWLFHPERAASPAMRAQYSRIEQALKVTDLLLQSGGFGLIVLDLGNISTRAARRVPLTSWFRFRRAVENTPTVLLVLEREAHARSCASLVLQLSAISTRHSAKPNQQVACGMGHSEKQNPLRRHGGTEKIIGGSDDRGIAGSVKRNRGFSRIDTEKADEDFRRGSTRMNVDLFSGHSAFGIQHSEEQHARSSMPHAAEPPSHAELLTRIDSCAEIARGERKGVASVRAEFASESAWSA